MRTLALDCSQIQATVCLIEEDRLAGTRTGSVDVAHSEALLPHIHALLGDAGWALSSIDRFAVGVGPGSFTGIRIGCATIKALAQVLVKPIIPFSSLRATALSAGPRPVVAMINAYQGQVFVGWNDAGSGAWREDAMPAAAWCDKHASGSGQLVVCGNGAKLFWPEIEKKLGERARLVAEVLYPEAKGILSAALENTNAATDYARLSANYMRPSQAEIKLIAK